MAKQKYYVVWKGLEPGIYDTWAACQQQVKGVADARYRSFATREEAEEAFLSPDFLYAPPRKHTRKVITTTYEPLSLAVDAACSGNPGPMEYRGVFVDTKEQVFHLGPIQGTNNIGEFLAIVHGLAYLEQIGLRIPIYSDSKTALAWIRDKKCKTQLKRTPQTAQALDLVARAERWLQTHTYETPIYKWETEAWGEIPADFGRK